MKDTSLKIISVLSEKYPDQVQFRRKQIDDVAVELGFGFKGAAELIGDEFKVSRGLYDLTRVIKKATEPLPTKPQATTAPVLKLSAAISSTINEDSYIPSKDETYVQWGAYSDVAQIIKSKTFYPIYIAGLSGNGKTMMVEQACASLDREYIRVQISPETDEDDLIGGFRLLNGDTVFAKGPVIKAMERGAILLVDEIDRATNKIMCLQGVLEGKPVLIKKTGEVIHPSPGFNVIATANTKGKGSDDGRFVAATIIDEAFLERFVATIEQPYASFATEKKIVLRHMEKYGRRDEDFAEKLCTWAEVIRKTFADDGVDEVISTRRLCHIAHSYKIFEDRLKAVQMCISRFDLDTKTAFLDLYTKIDPMVQPVREPSAAPTEGIVPAPAATA
jgi:hypothetical protein